MTTDTTIKNTAGRAPPARKRSIFSILGATVLFSCVFAGVAQAADNGNLLKDNGLLVNGIGSAAGPDLAGAGDQVFDCGEHVVECFDINHKSVGTILNGACYIHWTFPPECENDESIDLLHCKNSYGEKVQYTKSLSSCKFH